MSKRFGRWIECPHCGKAHTVESKFQRWLRNHPDLLSHYGYFYTDIDLICHRCKKRPTGEEVECMMAVEVKLYERDMPHSQRDSLGIFNQMLRNRRDTPTWKGKRRQVAGAPREVWSTLKNRWVPVRFFGVHLLQFSGECPEDSDSIRWDGCRITVDQLLLLLRFDLDPDRLVPLDLRLHHRREDTLPVLFDTKEGK